MRKFGSRLISIKQYKFTDLFLFALINAVFDVMARFLPAAFGGGAAFTFTITVPVTLIVMMRWGWVSVFFAVGDGLLLSLLNNTAVWQSYLSYGVGCAFMMVLLLATKFIGKQRIAGKWYLSALFVIAGWLLMNFGISIVQAALGYGFLGQLAVNFGMNGTGLLSLGMGLVIVLVARRLDGLFEDQKKFLLRMEEERLEKTRADAFGESPVEPDEEAISIIKKWDDGLD